MLCDLRKTNESVVHVDDDLREDAEAMLNYFFTSDDVLMSTTDISGETSIKYLLLIPSDVLFQERVRYDSVRKVASCLIRKEAAPFTFGNVVLRF